MVELKIIEEEANWAKRNKNLILKLINPEILFELTKKIEEAGGIENINFSDQLILKGAVCFPSLRLMNEENFNNLIKEFFEKKSDYSCMKLRHKEMTDKFPPSSLYRRYRLSTQKNTYSKEDNTPKINLKIKRKSEEKCSEEALSANKLSLQNSLLESAPDLKKNIEKNLLLKDATVEQLEKRLNFLKIQNEIKILKEKIEEISGKKVILQYER